MSSREEAAIRIAELSRRSGVPVPTIKFYIREGILPRGEPTAPNQARYGEAHLRRLALIGTLQRAGLSLAVIKRSLHAMDTMRDDSPEFMRIAVGSLPPFGRDAAAGDLDPAVEARASALLRAMVEHRGWQVDEGVPIWREVARAIAALQTSGPRGLSGAGLDRYAAAMEGLAAAELPDTWNPAASPEDALITAVQGTLLVEPLILALRRLAHIDRGNKLRARRAGAAAPPADDTATSAR
jgi:DNA-binding transcriptional MerR regulator